MVPSGYVEINTRSMICFSVRQFPMMGTVEEMKELISKGTFKAYENRVYLAGACNVGKSTLASILLGEEIPQSWKSTDGLIIYFGKNGIDLKNKTIVPLRKGNIT
jgi:ABC-type ATPase involved in cell division